MAKANENYLRLPGNYLFSAIAQKVGAYQRSHPEAEVIRLGIGDVTQPLAPEIIRALHAAVDEMGAADTFRGYAPDLGYAFLREKIAEFDYRSRGCDISPDEIFVSDGAKCDCSNIQEIFSLDNRIAVCDPVYPVYVDSNVMAGRTGIYDEEAGAYRDVIYMPCTAENGFAPDLPQDRVPDLIYLCFPNNPTGAVMKKTGCRRGWTMQTATVPSFSTMRLMRPISRRRECPTASTSARAPGAARSSSGPSPRQRALPAFAWALP